MLSTVVAGVLMRNVIILLLLICMSGILLVTVGCSNTEKTGTNREELTEAVPEKPAFDPDKPAPIPEGTPPY